MNASTHALSHVRRLTPTTQAVHDPMTFSQTAQSAVRTATASGAATILVVKTDDGVASYLVGQPGSNVHQAAGNLAHAVGAKAEYADEGWADPLEDTYVAVLAIDENTPIDHSQVSGTDPYELARGASRNLAAGDWVAVSFRPPSKRESARWRTWFEHNAGPGSGSHHSRNTNAVIITVLAGSTDSPERAHAVLTAVAGGMPGLDLQAAPADVSNSRRVFMPVLGLVASAVVGIVVARISAGVAGTDGAASSLAATWSNSVWVWLAPLLVCLGFAVAAYARLTDRLPCRLRRMWLDITAGIFPPPPKKHGRVRPPTREKRDREQNITTEESPGDYPLHLWTLKAGPTLFASLAAPANGALSGQRQTSQRIVPPQLTERRGPLIGESSINEQKAYLVASQLHYGVACIGEAGSGKSQLMRSLFGFDILEQLNPSNLPGFPGPKNSLIAIENKGPDGAGHYLDWAATLGQTSLLVDLADETTFGIEFLPQTGTMAERALRFVDALAYAFEDGSIQNVARTTLAQTVTLGLAVQSHPSIVNRSNEGLSGFEPVIASGKSFAYYGHILSGAGPGGDEMAKRLFASIKEEANEREDDTDLADAVQRSAHLFSLTPSERLKRTASSQNKLEQLAGMENWFSPARRKVTWRDIVCAFKPTVVNFGPAITGAQVPERQTKLMSAIAMYTLQQEIMQTCFGWEEKNQWVSIYVDELSLLAGSSSEPIVWLKDKGRSFGVRPYFATQRPTQVGAEVRETLLSMKTLVAYKQENAEVIESIVRTLDLDGSGWQPSDISQLAQYTAVVKTSDDVARLSAFTVAVANFEADRAAFAQLQGYAPVPAGGRA